VAFYQPEIPPAAFFHGFFKESANGGFIDPPFSAKFFKKLRLKIF